jgi:MFS family permease
MRAARRHLPGAARPPVARDLVEEAVTEPAPGRRLALRPAVIVWLLGLSQIVGYGTLYYSFSILADDTAASFGWPVSWLYGGLSLALLVGGLVAPAVGRRIDRHGAGLVMTVGSAGAALTLLVAALAPNGYVFTAATVGMQITGVLVLYDAAFAALVQATGPEARLRITHLTLIAGFASTIFWPLATFLHGVFGWRDIYLGFAAANLMVCLPVHLLLAQQRKYDLARPVEVANALHRAPPAAMRRRVLWLVTIGFALAGFALSAMLAQMVPMLAGLGLGASALVVSTLFGPAQVLVRFVNMLVGARRHPIVATLIAVGILPVAIGVLTLGAPWAAAAALFAILLGFGSGLKSIVQGTLPLALFGSASYGARLGHMAAFRQGLAALAPFVLALLIDWIGATQALWIIAAVGVLGLACMVEVARLSRRYAQPGVASLRNDG